MAAVTIAKTLAKKLGPKTVAKLKNMDTTLVGKEMADRSFEIMLKDHSGYQELKRIQKLI